ncbi:hypothetical protein ACFWFI_09630 [Streptomyces sp. NPDC060209]|uniref:hypothetical protein n=1 Tax=Streptomyces sp. NPDC060209 TaxID=3347073 RepID=UPI0036674076
MTGTLTLAQRRANVRQLAQGGASNRAIAAQMGISKDTVRRDLEACDAPAETFAQRVAHRRAQTETAMRELSAAAQAVEEAKPAYTVADDETALRWHAELCATVAQLTECAAQFAEYYPSATTGATDQLRPVKGGAT